MSENTMGGIASIPLHSKINTTSGTSTTGLPGGTCPQCGQWVSNYQYHYCNNNPFNPGPGSPLIPYYPPTITQDLTPLIAMIERLADEVEGLRKLLAEQEDM